MTEKLFYEDPFLKEFSATILDCREEKGQWVVTLDRTAFYPEGGGQPADPTLSQPNFPHKIPLTMCSPLCCCIKSNLLVQSMTPCTVSPAFSGPSQWPGADCCACCGTHVRSSGQVGMVKLISCQKFRDGVRI